MGIRSKLSAPITTARGFTPVSRNSIDISTSKPGNLLGRLAVSASSRGQNVGRFLLMDALHRSLRNTTEVASVGVVVEALDEKARRFYLHHEFQPLTDHPDKLFLAMVTIEKAFKP